MVDLTRRLTDINASDKKKANIQYSYPVAKVTNLSNNKYLLNFYGLNQNFSASVFDSYISGVCINATFYKNRHNTGTEHNAELVLEHKTPNSQTFYVVIPVNTGTTESNLDNIISEDPVLELNSLLKSKSMFYYQNTDSNHVFVFQNPISMKNMPSLQTAPMFNKSIKKKGKKFYY